MSRRICIRETFERSFLVEDEEEIEAHASALAMAFDPDEGKTRMVRTEFVECWPEDQEE